MAIPGFFGRWLIRHKFNNVLIKYRPKGSSLSIDMNSIVHQISQKLFADQEYLKGRSAKELEQECFDRIGAHLLEILQTIDVSDLFIIAIDGLAPMAKIKQQKQRRYMKTLTESMTPKEKKSGIGFDSNCISPGTEFMFRLDTFLETWLKSDAVRPRLPKVVIYSGHMDPGEGEHKIFKYLRRGLEPEMSTKIPVNPQGTHYIYGMDADLIMLSMICPLPNIVLYRLDKDESEVLVSISSLRICIRNLMSNSFESKSDDARHQTKEEKNFIDDFTILMLFFGNDFLPRLACTELSFELLDEFIQLYRTSDLRLTINGELSLQNLKKFIQKLSKKEETFIHQAISLNKQLKEPSSLLPWDHKGFNLTNFTTEWYLNELSYKRLDLLPKKMQERYRVVHQGSIKDLSSEYIKGFFWTYEYYKTGLAPSKWFFKYFHAPMLNVLTEDIKSLSEKKLRDFTRKDLTYEYSVLDQLAIIIPEESKMTLPGQLRSIYDIQSPIKDQMPKMFDIAWWNVAVLPPPELKQIKEALEELGMSVDMKTVRYLRKAPMLMNNIEYKKKVEENRKLRLFLDTKIQKERSKTLQG